MRDAALTVLIVTFETPEYANAYVTETGLTWPLLIDETRELYRAYGMERGRWWQIWGWSSWRVYMRLMLRGRRLRRPTGETSQLGGDVLIDPDGIVRLHHVSAGPADRPDVDDIFQVMR